MLRGALAQTGGQELFAGHPSSLAARLRSARGTVSDCEALLGAGRTPDSAPRPGVVELFDRWQAARAVATDPSRPQGAGRLKAQAQADLREADERADRLTSSRAMVPASLRGLFEGAISIAESQAAYQREQLSELASPAHPASVAVCAWELRYPDADQAVAEARAILDYEITEWAGLTGTPPLPPNVSPAPEFPDPDLTP